MYKLRTTGIYGHDHCLLHLTCPRPTQSSLTSNIRFPYSTGNSPVLQLLNKLVPLVLVVSILQNNVKSVDDTYKRSVNTLLEQCFFGTHRRQTTLDARSFAEWLRHHISLWPSGKRKDIPSSKQGLQVSWLTRDVTKNGQKDLIYSQYL